MTELGLPLLAGAALATLVGALAQRATGMGFALLAAPFLTLLLGPASGIAVALLPAAPLTIAVAAVVLAGLGATMPLRGRTLPPSRPLAAVGGLAAGFMSVTAGVAGPGVVVYARATGWSQRGFAATAQLVFLVLSLVSLLARRTVPALPPAGWALLLLALWRASWAGICWPRGSIRSARCAPCSSRRRPGPCSPSTVGSRPYSEAEHPAPAGAEHGRAVR